MGLFVIGFGFGVGFIVRLEGLGLGLEGGLLLHDGCEGSFYCMFLLYNVIDIDGYDIDGYDMDICRILNNQI